MGLLRLTWFILFDRIGLEVYGITTLRIQGSKRRLHKFVLSLVSTTPGEADRERSVLHAAVAQPSDTKDKEDEKADACSQDPKATHHSVRFAWAYAVLVTLACSFPCICLHLFPPRAVFGGLVPCSFDQHLGGNSV